MGVRERERGGELDFNVARKGREGAVRVRRGRGGA